MNSGKAAVTERLAMITHVRPIVRARVGARHENSEYQAQIATSEADLREAFALRYHSYRDSGFIGPIASGLFKDRFDDLPNAQTILVRQDGKAIASVRACFLSHDGKEESPGFETYPFEIGTLFEKAGKSHHGRPEALEVNRLVRSPEAANDQGLVFVLFRLVGHLALLNDFRVVVSCVRQNHVPFYRRLRFQEVAAAKPYPGLNCPMQLLALWRADYDEVRARLQIMDPEAGPPYTLRGLEVGQAVWLPLIHR